MNKILATLLLLFGYSLNSQPYIEIRNILTENYPTIRAEVMAYDENGEEYRDFADEIVTVTEDGENKPVTFQFCEQQEVRYSLIVVADISNSMALGLDGNSADAPNRRIDVLQRSLQTLVRQMNFGVSEFALITFAGQTEIAIPFSQDRDQLIQDLNEDITLKVVTDFNAAFIGENHTGVDKGIGAVQYARNAKWKPVIIFFSDGTHNVPEEDDFLYVRTDDIIDSVASVGALVFSAQLGGTTPSSISAIVNSSLPTRLPNGDPVDGVKSSLSTQFEIETAFREIRDIVEANPSALPPCDIEWLTDCDQSLIQIDGTVNGSPVSATATYSVPDNLKPRLEINNRNPVILNNDNVQITLEAVNAPVTITDANFSQGGFTINGINGLTIVPGTPTTVDVSYADPGNACIATDVSFNSTACSGNEMNINAGFLTTQNVFIGGATPGITSSVNEICFNNRFCSDVTITNVRIIGDPDGLFEVVFPGNTLVAVGGDATFEFRYTPINPGSDNAQIEITLDNGEVYTADIAGSSTGLPQISSGTDFTADDVVCDNTTELTIDITNPGPVPLTIDRLEIVPNTDFSIVGNYDGEEIDPNDTEILTVTIQFDPQSEGLKNATLTIFNDSENDNEREIALTGTQLDLNFEYANQDSEVLLGTLCPGETVPFDVIINNIGQAGSVLTMDDSNPNIIFTDNNQVDLSTGNQLTKNLELDASGLPAGPFDIEIILTDDCSGQQDILNVRGIIEEATTSYDATVYDYGANNQVINIGSNLGITTNYRLTLVNNYSRDLENIVATIVGDPNNVFEIDQANSDNSALAGGTYEISVDYTPNDNQNYSLELVITGDVDGVMCLDETLVPLNTGADVPTADLLANNVSALIGQEFTIDPRINDNNTFFSSGINNIVVDVAVPTILLASTDGVPQAVDGNLTVYTYTLDINNPQDLNFIALNPNDPAVNGAPIEFRFVGTEPAGRGQMPNSTIDFTLLRANADIGTNDLMKKPGEVVTVVINSSDFNGVDPQFHQAITGTLRFNASLLFPRGESPQGNLVRDGDVVYREIDFTLDLQNPQSVNGPDITTKVTNATLTFEFTALLGDSEQTNIEILNPASTVGEIDFDNVNIGVFTLDPNCKAEDGTLYRLFDPFEGTGIISVNGDNPVSSTTSLEINLIEDGNHKLYLVDSYGNIVREYVNDYMKHGNYNYLINADRMLNGVYFIILETPTQRLSEEIVITK